MPGITHPYESTPFSTNTTKVLLHFDYAVCSIALLVQFDCVSQYTPRFLDDVQSVLFPSAPLVLAFAVVSASYCALETCTRLVLGHPCRLIVAINMGGLEDLLACSLI